MLRAMYTSITGLRNHQTMLDNIGNNIANVNTFGFKASTVAFKDLIRQTMSGAGGPTPTLGGTNPQQIGLGMTIDSITQRHTQGGLQTTGVNTDLSIQGDGFFRVTDDVAGLTAGTPSLYYMRAGNFNWDGGSEGDPLALPAPIPSTPARLVTSDGMFVVGYLDSDAVTAGFQLDIADPLMQGVIQYDPATHNDPMIGTDGSVTVLNRTTGVRDTIAMISVGRFTNPTGLTSVGGNKWQESLNSGVPIDDVPNQNGMGEMAVGYLEMSNVDLATEFTEMIKAQRGFQANSRVITTSDEILQELVNLKR